MAQNLCVDPTANRSTTTTSSGSLFLLLCGVDWPKGDTTADGQGTLRDLGRSFVYTLQSCIEKCVSFNNNVSPGDDTCKGISYQANLTASFEQGGNCFLKDNIGRYFPAAFGGVAAGLAGG